MSMLYILANIIEQTITTNLYNIIELDHNQYGKYMLEFS